MHGMFNKTLEFTAFFGTDSLPQFFEMELCGNDCDKQNVHFLIWGAWLLMSGGKSGAKNNCFLTWGAGAEKMYEIVSKHHVVLRFVFSKHCKYQCFWLNCLGAGSNKSEENTGSCVTFWALCRKNIEKNCVFSHWLENTVSSGVLDDFVLMLQKHCKHSCFFF